MKDPLDLFQAAGINPSTQDDSLDLFKQSGITPSNTSTSSIPNQQVDSTDVPSTQQATQDHPLDLFAQAGIQVQPKEESFLDKAGNVLGQIGDVADNVVHNPGQTLEKIGDFGQSALESTPKVVGGAVQRAVTGLAELPLDIKQGVNTLGAKAAGAVGLDSVQQSLQDQADQDQAMKELVSSSITAASPDSINNLTPKEKIAADILALTGGGAVGARSALTKGASKIGELASGILGGAAGESAVNGSTVSMDPLVLGNDSTSREVKNRLLNPLEGIGLATGISAIPQAVKLAKTAADATVTSVANSLGKKPIQEIAQEASPEVADNVSRDALTSYYQANGMDTVEAVQKATDDLAKAQAGDKAIDPTLSKAGSLYSQLFDRLAMFRNIESELKGVTPVLREDTPLTADLQLETARQFKINELAATQGLPKKTEGGGLDLMTRSDVGLPEIPVDDAVKGTSKDPNLLPGLKQVFANIQEAGGDASEAAKYMQYKRIREDYDMFIQDTAAKESAISTAKSNIRDIQNKLAGRDSTDGQDINLAGKSDQSSDGINIANKNTSESTSTGYDFNLGNKQPIPSNPLNFQHADKAVTTSDLDAAKEALAKAKDMEIRRVGIGLPIEEVDSYIKQAETQPWTQVARDQFGMYFKGVRKYLLDEGTIDATQHQALEDFYTDFFPAFREPAKVDNSKNFFGTATSKGTGIKAATGGENPYKDPLESLLTYTSMFTTAGQRNAILNKAVDILEQLPDEGWNKLFNTSKADYQAQLLGVDSKKVQQVTSQQAAQMDNLLGDSTDLAGVSGVDVMPKEGVMTFYRDGKKVALEVNNNDLMNTLSSLSPGESNVVVKALDALKNIQRDAIVLSPGFSLANTLMDTSLVGITSKTGAKPLIATGQGIFRMSKDPELYAQYLRDTGGGTSWVNFGEARTQQEIDSLVSALKGEYRNGGMWKTYTTGAKKTLEELMNKAENSTRFEEYARTLEQGGTRTTAATRASELSVNFQQKGSSATLHQFNKVGLFLNATLQSQERAFRLIKDPGQLLKTATSTITFPALALYAYNTQFPGYYDIPEKTRHSNWIIMYGDKPEDHIKVPMDRVIAPVFAGIPYAILDDIANQTGGKSVANQIATAMRAFVPIPQFAPPVAQTIWNLNTNQDWQGRPIVRGDQTKQPSIEQYSNSTKPTYRLIAEGTQNIPVLPDFLKSPAKMDYVASQTLGFMEDIFTSFVTDPIAKKVLGLPTQASRDLSEQPVVNRFFGSKALDSTSQVYNLANNMQSDLAKVNFYDAALNSKTNIDESQLNRAEKFIDENPDKVEFLQYLQDTMKDMGDYNDEIRNIQMDSDMNAKDKQAEIKQAISDRDEIAKSFIQDIKENEVYRPFLAYTETDATGLQPLITKGLLKASTPDPAEKKGSLDKLGESVRSLLNRNRGQ